MRDDALTLSAQQSVPGGAELSPDGVYRYRLWREWDAARPTALFVMLNPSTADARQDDPTVRRCIRYARDWGYGRLLVGNLFALRSTDPRKLYRADDPVGPDNDACLMDMHDNATLTVCAWGVHGNNAGRGSEVIGLLSAIPHGPLHCLRTTSKGFPSHPLYLPKDAKPIPYTGEMLR